MVGASLIGQMKGRYKKCRRRGLEVSRKDKRGLFWKAEINCRGVILLSVKKITFKSKLFLVNIIRIDTFVPYKLSYFDHCLVISEFPLKILSLTPFPN